jgi:hypothetical protein
VLEKKRMKKKKKFNKDGVKLMKMQSVEKISKLL